MGVGGTATREKNAGKGAWDQVRQMGGGGERGRKIPCGCRPKTQGEKREKKTKGP